MRDTILSNIRQSLNGARALPHSHTPIPLHPDSDRETLIAQFESEWLALGGQFERAKSADAIDRDPQLVVDDPGHLRRDGLHQERERSGRLDC